MSRILVPSSSPTASSPLSFADPLSVQDITLFFPQDSASVSYSQVKSYHCCPPFTPTKSHSKSLEYVGLRLLISYINSVRANGANSEEGTTSSLLMVLHLLLLSLTREATIKDSCHHHINGRSSKSPELIPLQSVNNLVVPVPCTAVTALDTCRRVYIPGPPL